MPELPEVELARATIQRAALHRSICEVDDSDDWECRPHPPGQIRAALLGRELTGAFRRGKSMWCTTSGSDAPVLGIHLGMSGVVMVSDGEGRLTEGGDWPGGGYGRPRANGERKPVWDRFTLTFTDGGHLRLLDPRRLGRVRLDPDLTALGPDAAEISAADLGARVGRGTAPVKARLLDQSVVAGVGNLLADETLWRAGLSPRRPSRELTAAELDRLHRSLQQATGDAIRLGGVHTGGLIPFRRPGHHCPRCGTELVRATVGGRTTWWCPREQV